jgi:1,3,6,8-tetrahydroxynaphthalene synthase
VLCCPVVHAPEHDISVKETITLARSLHRDHPKLETVVRLIQNTEVQHRQLIRSVADTFTDVGFGDRNRVFAEQARARVPAVVAEALAAAGLRANQIDQIVFVSCTGFMMPSMTAWMINELGFRPDTVQLPIAQLGCVAGAAAINRANEFCRAHPGANSLVVCCEFCSLLYQPADTSVGQLMTTGLFGDAVGAVVIRSDGDGVSGLQLGKAAAALVPGTGPWISYNVEDTGFHFRLDRGVPGAMTRVAPVLRQLASDTGWDVRGLDFYAIHAGGPKILDVLADALDVPRPAFRTSRTTLHEHGNIASVVILDVLQRLFTMPHADGDRGLIAAFGPGVSAEAALATWTAQ